MNTNIEYPVDVHAPIEGVKLVDVEARTVITAYIRYLTFEYEGVEYYAELRYDPNNGYEFQLMDDNTFQDAFKEDYFMEKLDNMCIRQAELEGIEDVHDN
jgi:hypothetical protein